MIDWTALGDGAVELLEDGRHAVERSAARYPFGTMFGRPRVDITLIDLRTLGGISSSAADMNELGQVVGTFTAFFDGAFGVGAVSAGGVAALLGFEGAFVAAGFVAGTGLGLLVYRKVKAVRARRAAVS